MPYITQYRRDVLDILACETPNNAGELNYMFTRLAINYLRKHGETYQHHNDIIGALEGAKLELYRRRTSIYEDGKIQQNGDVY